MINPLTPKSDQSQNSFLEYQYNTKGTSDEKKRKLSIRG